MFPVAAGCWSRTLDNRKSSPFFKGLETSIYCIIERCKVSYKILSLVCKFEKTRKLKLYRQKVAKIYFFFF